MSLSIEIASYLKYLKDENVLSSSNFQYNYESPVKSQSRVANKKGDVEKR